MKRTIKSLAVFWGILCIAILLPVCRVSADMGPKPSMELHIENPPEGVYYVDLLVEADAPHDLSDYENTKWDPVMFDALIGYYEDGYRARLRGDFGVDFDIEQSNDNHINDFIYMLPASFKVIIVTEQGECIASENAIGHGTYDSVAYFDCETRTLTDDRIWTTWDIVWRCLSTAAAYGFTLLYTLIIEGTVVALFFPKLDKRYWKIFLFANMGTQVFLYVILFALPTSLLPASAIAAEVVIAVSEAMIFRRWMHSTGCAKRSRLVIAAVVANIMSAAAGIVSMFL